MNENADKQNRKHNYDWLNGYKFVKGISGNPKGRPPGKSLKTFAREFLESLPDDEKVGYLKSLPESLVWQMAEGNPENKTGISIKPDIETLSDTELLLAEQLLAKRRSKTVTVEGDGSTSESLDREVQDKE